MPLLHHLARTGGTLISRCLASMDDVCVLSEIHPAGASHFNPLRQAADWYGFVSEEEARSFDPDDSESVRAAIDLIHERAHQVSRSLIVRDWSHLDWIGFPFVTSPPMRFTWDEPKIQRTAIGEPVESVDPHPIPDWRMRRCATVRHPIDQYRSTRKLHLLQASWDESAFWTGTRQFAEAVQTMPWFRYEDFLAAPHETLCQLCYAFDIEYDPAWEKRWFEYKHMTGDSMDPNRKTIRPEMRKPVGTGLWDRLRGNQDLMETLDVLGYPTPEPLRRKWYFTDEEERPVSLPMIGKNWDNEVIRYRRECDDNADDIASFLGLAKALRQIGQVSEAADTLIPLAKTCHRFSESEQVQLLTLVSELLERVDRKFEGLEFRRHLAQLEPNNQNNLFQLSVLLGGVGEVDEALCYSRRLLTLNREHLAAAANFLLYMNYSDRYTTSEVSNEHFRLGMRFTSQPDFDSIRKQPADGLIRIGYLGSDFYTHPVGKIMLPILESHDRKRFHVTVYHDGKKTDSNTQAIRKSVDAFKSIHGMKDDEVTNLMRGDELDVLVDLGGYTGGGNRLKVLSQRVSPAQVSFLGYPNTSAIPTMDYHLTDHYADPPGLTESFYGEQLVWLNHSHLAWRPYEIARDIERQSLGPETDSGPVLGVFNNVAKISPTAIRSYATIMRRVPDAKLVLKYGDRYSVATVQDRFRREFSSHGITPDRLRFRTQSEPLKQHLTTMKSVDLALDSFPYQGTMTSLECLAVGTPIVSCSGEYYAHRATSAMMMRMGLYELVASDPEEYIEIAVQLANDRETLSGLRELIQERFGSGPLTDTEAFTRELESNFERWYWASAPK